MIESLKIDPKQDLKRIVVITLAALLAALDINTFVHAGGLYPGGVMGLTILVQNIGKMFFGISVPFTPVSLCLNLIPIYIGFKYIGKKFTLFSFYFIMIYSVFTDLIPSIEITQDILLISIFGGLINGLVIGTCLLMSATTGGTDFIGIFLSERLGMDSFNIILGVNAMILFTAGLLFGWDKALYSIIFQYASTQILHIIYRKFQQGTLFVVTKHPQRICSTISEMTRHGATIINVEGGFSHEEKSLVYSMVSESEIKDVLSKLKKIDPEAFVNVIRTERMSGRFYYKKED